MADMPTLPILADGLPLEAGVLTQWLAGLPAAVSEVVLDPVPPISAHLPDVLVAAGIERVVTSARAHALRWVGPAGGTVVVNGTPDETPSSPPWRGDLPHAGTVSIQTDSERTHGTRMRQAAAAGVLWRDGAPPAVPGVFTAWNPVPFARRALVAFPAAEGRAPWSLRDPRTGARHPVQVVEGALGPEWLASLPLGALEVARFVPEYEPVEGGAPWEVSEEILDNGLVRMELDLFGQIDRLCFGGHFIPRAAPLLRAGSGDHLLTGAPARCIVHEAGPVRARVGVTRELPGGVLHLTYTQHAFDPCLRVSMAWDGDGRSRWLDLTTTIRAQPWQRSGGWLAERITDPDGGRWHHGLTWAQLDDGDGGGLIVAGSRPWSAAVGDGCLRVADRPSLTVILSDPRLCDPTTMLDRWVAPAVAIGPSDDQRPFRLVAPPGVATWWLRREADGACALTLAELAGRAARLWFYPSKAGPAWLSDLRGGQPRDLASTPEGDGVQVDLAAGAIAVLHWRHA